MTECATVSASSLTITCLVMGKDLKRFAPYMVRNGQEVPFNYCHCHECYTLPDSMCPECEHEREQKELEFFN